MTRKDLFLIPLLTLGLTACPPTTDDDDSGGGGDDDDAVGNNLYGIVLHGSFGSDATVTTVDVEDGETEDVLGLTGSDWAVAIADGDPWLIGRSDATIRRYAGLDFSAPTLEFSTGAGTNPHDMEVCGDRVFVSRYGLTEDLSAGGDVAMFDLATGGPLGRVDLSAYNPHGDGTPEPADMVQVDGTVYVSLERLDQDNGWVADPAGKLVAIDCTTGTISADWDIGANSEIGLSDDASVIEIRHAAGVSLFDTGAGAADEAIADADLGENYDSLAFTLVGDVALIVAEVNWATNEVWCLDMASGDTTLLTSVPQRGWAANAAPDGTVWVAWIDHWATPDDVEAGGIAIYDPAACTEVGSAWMSFASDPITFAFFGDE